SRPAMERSWAPQQNLSLLFAIPQWVRRLLMALFLLGLLVFNVLPVAALIFYAADFSLWTELPWLSALGSTLLIGVLSSAFVGILMAALFMFWKSSSKRMRSVLDIFALGYGLPGTLLAVAFYLFSVRTLGLEVLSTGGY